MTIIDGKKLAGKIKEEIKQANKEMRYRKHLAIIKTNEDLASQTYINNKVKACIECGFDVSVFNCGFSANHEHVFLKELLFIIDELNTDYNIIDGYIIQLPLRFNDIDFQKIKKAVLPEKDVDGLFYDKFTPCTPKGIMRMFQEYDINLESKLCVVIGRSEIVGKPMQKLLQEANATVICCNSYTNNLKELCLQADIIISAVGKEKFITTDMVKQDAVVIDVGINRDADGKLCGDVDFENVKEKCSFITPVPGGVGAVTVAMLLENLLES